MSSKSKGTTPRQRGTPSPGSGPQQLPTPSRTSPRRANATRNNVSSGAIGSHRRVGSGNARSNRQLLHRRENSRDADASDAHEDFLSQSVGYDRTDDEVHSIYLGSLDPRQRDSLESLVMQQKKDAGFTTDSVPATGSTRKNTSGHRVGAAVKQPIVISTSDLESNISDLSDTPTEVETYNSVSAKQQHSRIYRGSGENVSVRPGAQRAILEIASQMDPDEISHIIELLSRSVTEGRSPLAAGTSGGAFQSQSSSRQQAAHQQHPHASPSSRRSKSGPPVLYSGGLAPGQLPVEDEDEEVKRHTHHTEAYRILLPAAPATYAVHHAPQASQSGHGSGSYSTTPVSHHHTAGNSKYRCGSGASNASGTNSAATSRNSTPVTNLANFKKSPIPVSHSNSQQHLHDFCPGVFRDDDEATGVIVPVSDTVVSETASSSSNGKVNVVPKLVLPINVPDRPSVRAGKKIHSYVDLPSSIQSPRSAFDDCSVSSASTNVTGASNRSGRSKNSSTVHSGAMGIRA